VSPQVESNVSLARGGLGGDTDNGLVTAGELTPPAPGNLDPPDGEDGDLASSSSAAHALHQWSLLLNVTLSPGSNFLPHLEQWKHCWW